MQPRHWIMLCSLAATLVLVFSLEDEDDAMLEPMPAKRAGHASQAQSETASQAQSATTGAASTSLANANTQDSGAAATSSKSSSYLAWGLLEGRAAPAGAHAETSDLFRSQQWYIPPPKTAAELAPAPPVAPEPGFAYMGKLEEGPQGTVILLASANRLYSVSVGERVDPNWRLDHEDEQSLGLTYLPLNLPKTLLKKSKVAAPVNPASHLQGDPDDLQGNL